MSTRLAKGGRLIDRSKTVKFSFNGKSFTGYQGDTLASALLANDQMLVGRSFKYHRPRGIVASGAEEPNALVNLGSGVTHEPNQRATTTELFEGLTATPQNVWPSLDFDIGAVNSYASRLLTAGFYYKMFMYPRAFWKHVYEPFIRQSAGLGKAPDAETRDPDTYEHFYAFVDVLVIGGGVAGLQAAKTAADSGAKVLLMEQTADWGGRSLVDGGSIDGKPAVDWIKDTLEALENMPNVTLRNRMMGAGVYDHGYALGYERLTDHAPKVAGPRHRLWRIRAKQIVTATGAIERPLSFAGNDIPGVMLAAAVRDYVINHGVSIGDRTVVVTNNDDAYRTAIALKEAGLDVPVIVDAREFGGGALMEQAKALGIRVETGCGIAKVHGKKRVTSVDICKQAGEGAVLWSIPCEAVAMSGGWSPVVHLWSHCGGKLNWDDTQAFFRPDATRPPKGDDGEAMVRVAGSANGELGLNAGLQDAAAVGQAAAAAAGFEVAAAAPQASEEPETPIEPIWQMPQGAHYGLRLKSWLDFQNDVKVSDVQLAAQEGYESVEHTKRYTTLGMATDQGKLSNINGLATLSNALGEDIPQVGTTTFRPPYTPISMGAIAGEARGEIFQPIRKTPMHDWHEANGAHFEPVGHWRRPYAFVKSGESVKEAVHREVLATRNSLGLLDASTLGKIIVKGPDAGKFMDMMYTNMMSNLKIGKCRYGLMCTENGFLTDDGVVARIDEDTWLCHTTTGGADRIHAHMEEWLQTEWWDWKVYTANITEQLAQVAVVGPNARKLLEKLGGMDVSKEALPFMEWRDGELGGFPVRAYRISFSGELSYEIAVPANLGRAFWDKLLEAGAEWNATPYGTECLHIMRAEKGFIMIGDETDGTVIPQDLGLNWAISKKKEDFLGKRAQQRSHMTDPKRWKLVGLETVDGSTLPDGAYAVAEGKNANGQRNTQGRVTSTYHSPTLNKGIAMGLVLNGPDRMGEVIEFAAVDGETMIGAKIVSPVFFDPDGEKQNV
ncbi:sarcosine oxidase subunit alpha family protein [Tropicibacter sp. R15_0]|uniref:sarcosine oxidase subunit alpha family protein n=1 Tax=Tropicibacter sp. R15_0 TaxID=2821101 RepID=UPI001ADCEA12|nr:sarcosine oxidase subunit alpha family protein [Tropicibacter sp. R15_0]MBO9464980.1 sarcosine oxidase subunit alpha family protein [Tropicibacter sp. R15_0]